MADSHLRSLFLGISLAFSVASCTGPAPGAAVTATQACRQPDEAMAWDTLPTPDFGLTGWASAGAGTTGGAGGETVTVTSPGELVTQMERPEPLVILVKGTIDMRENNFPGYSSIGRYAVASNKSVIGVGNDSHIRGAELRLAESTNVIIRNLILSESPDTAIAISGKSRNVWVDHNEIYDAPDGLIDITTGANWITVSWNRLHGAVRMGLSGRRNNRSLDRDTIRVTYHHNWFCNLQIRVPHAYWGRHHIFNNYYTNISQAAIEVGAGTQIVSENNFFHGVRRAYFIRDSLDEWAKEPGAVLAVGSIYRNIVKKDPMPNTAVEWHPSEEYPYTLDDAADVPSIVMRGAGVGIVETISDSSQEEAE